MACEYERCDCELALRTCEVDAHAWPSAGKESVNTIDIGVDSISILFHASALTNVSHWFFQLAFLD